MGYASDASDEEWEEIKELFEVGNYGNRRKHEIRSLLNAVRYVVKTGCQWRMLPKDFPAWQTVFAFYSRARQRGIWEKIRSRAVEKSRLKSGRNGEPSYAIIDSQSVKTVYASEDRGIDGGKKN